MPPKQHNPSYRLDQEVLCAHGANHYYSARIIDIVQAPGGEPTYRVHYKGWNVRYDEDIPESETKKRFMEHTPANVAMAAKAIKEARMKAKARKRSTVDAATKRRVTGGSDSRQSTPADQSRAHSAESDGSTPSAKFGSAKQRGKGPKGVTGPVKTQGRPRASTSKTPLQKEKDAPAKGQNTPRPRPSGTIRKRSKAADNRDDSDTGSEELGVPHAARKDVKDRSDESPDAELGTHPDTEDEALDDGDGRKDGRKLKFDMPQELKMFLLDGEDISKRLMMLPHLPARVTVDEIMEKYIDDTKETPRSDSYPKFFDSKMKEICVKGVKECFNVVLGRILLYKFERPQYTDFIEKGEKEFNAKRKSSVAESMFADDRRSRRSRDNSPSNTETYRPNICARYGFMHLLRMLVAFEKVVHHLGWPTNSLHHIDAFLEDFAKYLVEKKDEFCNIEEDFYESDTEYQRRVWNSTE